MLCLGIESTAHTFASSVTDYSDHNQKPVIVSDVRSTYIAPAGSGIHPREASRHHASVSARIIEEALRIGGIKCTDLSIVAYSAGPGLRAMFESRRCRSEIYSIILQQAADPG